MKRYYIFAFLFFSIVKNVFVFADPATVLVTVGDTKITQSDFDRKYNLALRAFPNQPPSREEFLEQIIDQEVGIQEAKKIGLERKPEIKDRLDATLFQGLIETQLSQQFGSIQISNDDAEAFYKKNPEIRLSQIFISLPFKASTAEVEKAKQSIQKIYEMIQSGKTNFAEAAQRYSEGIESSNGGDLGYQMKDRVEPSVWIKARELSKPGDTSGVIRSPYGFHILQLTGIRPWNEVDRAKVKRLVLDSKKAEIYQAYIKNLKSKTKVTPSKDS